MAIPIVPIIIGAATHSAVAFFALRKGYKIGYRDGIAAGDWLKSTPEEWEEVMNNWIDSMNEYFDNMEDRKEEPEETKE